LTTGLSFAKSASAQKSDGGGVGSGLHSRVLCRDRKRQNRRNRARTAYAFRLNLCSCVLIDAFIVCPLSFAGCLESCRPPEEVVDHDVGLLVKLGEAFVYVPALEMRPKRRNGNVNR
jgi:hypothetical protein